MSEDENRIIPPQPRPSRTPAGWAIYGLWVVLAIGLVWLAFNVPPGVWHVVRAVFKIAGAFT